MDLRIEDRVYLVTGASSGIGEAPARLPASEGATVTTDLTDPGAARQVVDTVPESLALRQI
ncbi:hypothetical protein ACGFYU_13010 [Streptomyces sp. NPDC048337]|uniref:hypothetical protein n=1 Tax=Streptomyces sp. NPDC048337 TaxID=3365535 RepID=UPI003717FB8B